MKLRTWWHANPAERYWLEITDRRDLGVDLSAPQAGLDGKEVWHYSLINEVRDGDIVLHYHRLGARRGIIAWSRASGTVWEDDIEWAPHAGPRQQLQLQPGWRISLEGFHPLPAPVWFETIREAETELRVVEAELEEQYGKPLYTPFEMGTRQTRPKQAYLAKFPLAYLELFPSLLAATTAALPSEFSNDATIGEPYRRPDEDILIAASDPFDRDPSLVERSLRSHAATQNALADYLDSKGLTPLSPSASDPNFDLAWNNGDLSYVAEIKSLSLRNEERQLRLGLGQVLRYRQLLGGPHRAIAVLATPRPPSDEAWEDLAEEFGVILCWPGTFDRLHNIQPH